MIRLPVFDYHTPTTLDEASRMLSEFGSTASIVAGGTDLFPKMKRRQFDIGMVVDLGEIEGLRGVRVEDGGEVVIGALTSLAEISESTETLPTLSAAAALVASPQIRNVATIGGNLCLDTRCNYYDMSEGWRQASGFCLKDGGEVCWVAPKGSRCWAVASSDLAPVVVALDAAIRLVSVRGERTLQAADLYHNDGIDYLTKAPDEILTEVRLPRPAGWRSVYLKLRRRGAIDFPLLGAAVALRFDGDGTCTDARIVLGGVSSAPVRLSKGEEILIGNRLTDAVIEQAADEAGRHVRPLDTTDLGSRYRKWMVSVYVNRALRQLVSEDPGMTIRR